LADLIESLWSLLGRRDGRIDPSSQSLTLADLSRPDAPLIYVNRGFEKMTGYRPDEVIGRNCRFLQGPQTDRATIGRIRDAVQKGEPLIVDILNYRKDGGTFWNRLSLRPVFDNQGAARYCVGIQSDITRMRELEERMAGYAAELAALKRTKIS
jgi:PAS domain S-box-containing protein